MSTVLEPSALSPLAGIRSLELEITGKCQLTCTHCLSEAAPRATHGAMTPADWREFTEQGLSLGLHVEVYSNLFHVAQDWWGLFARKGVTLGTSYYSDDPEEHDKITGRSGSYLRTRGNIHEAVARGIKIRAGIVDILPGQRVAEARAELEHLGVRHINTDRVRAVGRAALPGVKPTLDEMCGRCTRGRAAVLPDGELTGCVLSRDFPAGNVRETRLAGLLGGKAWAELAASVPPPRAACTPNDSSDCDPAGTEACDPAY